MDAIEFMLNEDEEKLNIYIQENAIKYNQRAVVHHYFFMKYARFDFQLTTKYWMRLAKRLKYV
jgi:hypothetical protein